MQALLLHQVTYLEEIHDHDLHLQHRGKPCLNMGQHWGRGRQELFCAEREDVCLDAAGEDAGIHLDLQGSQRSSGPRVLAPDFAHGMSGLFCQGQVELLLPDLGKLQEAVVGHCLLSEAPGWQLEVIKVEEAASGQVSRDVYIVNQDLAGCACTTD